MPYRGLYRGTAASDNAGYLQEERVMQRLKMRPDLVMPVGVDRILTRRIKANLSVLRRVQALQDSGELKLCPEALERAKQRVKRLLEEIRTSRRKTDKGEKTAKLKVWEERKKMIRDRVARALHGKPMRSPEQVLGELVRRIQRLGGEEKATDRV